MGYVIAVLGKVEPKSASRRECATHRPRDARQMERKKREHVKLFADEYMIDVVLHAVMKRRKAVQLHRS